LLPPASTLLEPDEVATATLAPTPTKPPDSERTSASAGLAALPVTLMLCLAAINAPFEPLSLVVMVADESATPTAAVPAKTPPEPALTWAIAPVLEITLPPPSSL